MKNHIVFLALLAGCAQAQTLPPLPAEDTCRASVFEQVIGQPKTALERILFMGKIRIIAPNTAVTMDYQPDRVNVMLDEMEIITAITCG